MEHTPGPWGVGTGWIYAGDLKKGRLVCAEIPISEQGDANARLIAAAPELLEALKALTEYMQRLPQHSDRGINVPELRKMGEQAITKAESK